MKYLPLLFANLKRKKVRTALTIGSFVVAMFLWSLLLFIRAHGAVAHPPPVPPGGADDFSWVFLVHIPQVVKHPHDPGQIAAVFEALAFSGVAFLIAGLLGRAKTRA